MWCGLFFFGRFWSWDPSLLLVLNFVALERVDWKYHTREGLLISSIEGGKGA